MKKRWNIIFLIAVFICANVATFLFAYGKVRIVEKIVTVYEKEGTKSEISSASNVQTKTETVPAKLKALKAASIDFNDADYFTESEKLKEAEMAQDVSVDPETAKDEVGTKTAKPEEAAVGHVAAPDTDSAISSPKGPQEQVRIADESIVPIKIADDRVPIPQLPLFDTDFEAHIDRGGDESISLPQLPDISEVISD